MADQEDKDILLRLDDKVDSIQSKIGDINVTLGAQAVQIAEHIRRTGIAEENIEMLRNEIKPLQKRNYMVDGGLKLLGGVVASASVIIALIELLSYLKIIK